MQTQQTGAIASSASNNSTDRLYVASDHATCAQKAATQRWGDGTNQLTQITAAIKHGLSSSRHSFTAGILV